MTNLDQTRRASAFAICAFLALGETGNAAEPSAPGDVAATDRTNYSASAAGPVLIDARPDDEKKTRTLSNFIFSCEFGVQVWGDDIGDYVKPKLSHLNRIERLRSSIPSGLSPHKITIVHYGLYVNISASRGAAAVGGALLGPVGTLSGVGTPNLKAKCPQEKTPFGWFDATEITTAMPPFIVQMELDIDGTPVVVRSVYSPQKGEDQGTSILGALDKANSAVVAQLSKAIAN